VRPLELKLRNFRSYFGEEASIDFRGRRLVGIVGPIGSGKSTILDAIAFALYGRTPTIAQATKSLIHQRASDGGVSLRFEIEEEIWEAARVLRKGGASVHALYRYDEDLPDAEPVEKIVQESDVNAKIVELLGLEFDTFSRSVLLAQGRFAEFLNARPAERDKVLKGLFGLGRVDAMRDLARSRARDAEIEVEKLTVRVEHVADLEAELALLEEQLSEVSQRCARLDDAAEGVAELDGEAAEFVGALETATGRAGELRSLRERLPDGDAVAQILEVARSATAERKVRADALAAAESRLGEASDRLDELEKRRGRKTIEQAGGLLAQFDAARDRLLAHEGRMQALVEREEKAGAAVAEAEEFLRSATAEAVRLTLALEEAEVVVAAAAAAHHEVIHRNMAAELRRSLVVGEPCPVCDQDVPVVPGPVESGDVETADAALHETRLARDDAATGRRTAEGLEAKAAAQLEASIESRNQVAADLLAEAAVRVELEAEWDRLRSAISGLLGDGDPAVVLEEMRSAYDDAVAAAAAATKAVERARADHDEMIVAQQRAESGVNDLRVRLVDIAARSELEIEIDDVATGLDSLRRSMDTEIAAAVEAEHTATIRLELVEEKRRELFKALDVEIDFAATRVAFTERKEILEERVAAAQDKLAADAHLTEELRRFTLDRDIYSRLASDLTDAKFTRYLLDEERTRLAEIGSEHFQRLSSGRYRFTDDGVFDVVDLTAADAVRKPDSLSGGETFIASLGLALALAEMVAREGGRLDAFFLDEGFGSLDPEHLDLAMEGIEALVADSEDRLVVVVSHVPEMRYRLDDLIVLERDATTGDTRVLSP